MHTLFFCCYDGGMATVRLGLFQRVAKLHGRVNFNETFDLQINLKKWGF